MVPSTTARTASVPKGLLEMRKDGHWSCSDEFLELTGLPQAKMARSVVYKKKPIDEQLALDVLATEIALLVMDDAPEKQDLPQGWKRETMTWIDGAFSQAFQGASLPPPRNFLVIKAAVLLHDVRAKDNDRSCASRSSVVSTAAERSVCETCGYKYPAHLANCPQCSRRQRESIKQEQQADIEAKEAEWRSLPSAPIGGLKRLCQPQEIPNWAEATEWRHCEGGSGGVFMLRLPEGVVCVKAGAVSAGEFFAEGLAQQLNVRVASSRPVQDSQERGAILHAFEKAAPLKVDEMVKKWQLRRGGAQCNLCVIEFVVGCPMMGLPAHNRLSAVSSSQGRAGISAAAETMWKDLGRLMAFDVLINNFDRMPLVWSNEGNLANIMLSQLAGNDAEEAPVIVGIDQKISPILHDQGLKAYLERVRGMITRVSAGSSEDLARIKGAIYANTAIELSEAEIALLREGLMAFFQEISASVASGMLEQHLEAVCSGGAWEDSILPQWREDAARLVRAVAEVVRSVLDGVEPS
eukprot:CAMPEP_0178411620 /NCGR_PEP_ID=MMETSP0689_2-20121128/21586_1 /TAXON_ID=160604 /ORGANISM="Amphidinium massartii, Strain CS-259" /LENGTH=522 /DNA_ID=CAMNT_0020032827 /DNA_START=80 /DNA_END=1644 /DNA_ORIENTATION=+